MHAGATPLVATGFLGRGDGPIVGNNVMCRGDEDGIIGCIFDRNHNCGHENDVAVRCMTTDTGEPTYYAYTEIVLHCFQSL